MSIVQYSEEELQRRLAIVEREPDPWIRSNARGALLGERCCRCLAVIITGKPAPRKRVLCPRCVSADTMKTAR